MSEIAKLLRFLVQADKEAKITAVTAEPQGPHTQFSTGLTSGQTRKGLSVYNNSDSSSGECFFGYDENMSGSGETSVIPKATLVSIPIADVSAIPLFLCAASGEFGDLRVEEYA